MTTLRSKLNAIYEPLLEEFFDKGAIEETKATCDSCAMCKVDAPGGVKTEQFNVDTKCCTYHPTLPNYLVGAILTDARPELAEGKRRISEKIDARIGITPQWLSAPRKFLVHLEAARYTSFGRAKVMLCPYYDDGKCTVWYHRESVCRFFFCKYDGGMRGWAFWEAVKQYFFRVELVLSKHAIDQIDPNMTEPDIPRLRMSLEDLEDKPPPDDEYARYWASFLGKEKQFYEKANEVICGISQKEFKELIDESTKGKGLLEDVKKRHEELTNPKLEARLMLTKKWKTAPAEGGIVATTYSRYDPFFMSQALKEVAERFDGTAPVDDVLAGIKRDLDLDVPQDLLMRMRMLEVLVPPAEPAAETEKKDE